MTPDWKQAKESVQKLNSLMPALAVTGHGPAMEGEELKRGLEHLTQHFEEVAVPDKGRYVYICWT